MGKAGPAAPPRGSVKKLGAGLQKGHRVGGTADDDAVDEVVLGDAHDIRANPADDDLAALADNSST